MARNSAIDRLRRRKARPPASDLPVDESTHLPAPGPSPEDAWLSDARKRLVYRALDRMSEQNREMILLKEIQGMNLNEIAEMLGVPIGTVKSRSNRARLELAKRVVELDPSYGAP
jgi:RNA polymerase sigma-70 factor (ECF subfamily)